MRNAVDSGGDRPSFNKILIIAGVVVSIMIGLGGLIGWIFQVPVFTAFHSNFIPIAPSTALILCTYSLIILGVVRTAGSPFPTTPAWVWVTATGVVTGASILLTITSAAGVYLPVEHLGIPIDGTFYTVPIGHISPVNAAFFTLTGMVILIHVTTSGIHNYAFRFMVAIVGLLVIVPVLLLIAYAAGGPVLYGTMIIPPALTTTVGLVGLVCALGGLLARRVASDRPTIEVLQRTFPYRYVGTAFLGTGLLLLAMIVSFRQYTNTYRNAMRDEIVHAADMSVDRIARWRRERIADGRMFAENDHFVRMVRAEATTDLAVWLQRIADAEDYTGAAILSSSGAVLLSTYRDDETLVLPSPDTIAEVLDQRAVTIIGSAASENQARYTHPLVPVPLIDHSEPETFGAVLVFETDFVRTVREPMPSATPPGVVGKTFLVMNDRGVFDVLDVSNALVTPVTVPITEAITDIGNLVEGEDDEGTPVIAVARTVPDSPWIVVVQMPASVLLRPLSRQLYVLAGANVLVLVFLVLIGVFMWRSREARYYQSFYAAQRSLRASEDRYRITLQSIGDAVIATDAEGRVEFMNAVAEELTGWSLQEAAGRPVGEIFYIVQEDHRTPLEDPVQQVLQERRIVELSDRTELIARDDRRFPVRDTAAPMFSGTGEISGVVLVFRDQTEDRYQRKQLERNENRLRRLFDNMASGFVLHEIITDDSGNPVDFRYLELNDAFTGVTGIGRDAIGKRLTEIFPDRDEYRDEWLRRIGDVGVNGRTTRFEAFSRPFRRWLSVIAYSPEPGKVAAIVDDITQRHITEQELAFRSKMIERVGDAVMATDPEGTVLFWNDAATALFGWTVEEALGRRQEELLPSEDLTQQLSEITDSIDGRASWTGEAWFKRKDGSDVIVLLTVTPTFNDDDEMTAVIATGRDITARKTLELRYAGLFQSISDAIVITDRDREIVDCNDAFTKLFGYTREEVAGRNVEIIYETTDDRETHFRRRDGTVFHGETNESRLRDVDGNDLGYVEVIHDLTEHDLLQQELIAAQKTEALGLIAGGITHDFNNVLAAINGAVQMLAILVEEESVMRYVDIVRSSVRRGMSITTRMLTFIRHTEPDTVSLGLGSFLAEFVDIARHTLPQNVHLRVEGIDDTRRVRVDPVQLQQVLFTLASNAADAMSEGGEIVFTIRRPHVEELRYHQIGSVDTELFWCLDVSDNGVGMDEETQRRIFEPFFTTKDARGTGIGLSVVATILRLHRGWVGVTSTPGAGTTFTIALPSGPVPTAETASDTTRPDEIVHGGDAALLIVDDEESVRVMLEEVFSTDGYRVFTADSAGTALDILTQSLDEVDLVLTDIGLPDMNGKNLITRVRALSSDIPVIAMTGYVDEGLTDAIYAVGANVVANKPYDIHHLSGEIARLLRESTRRKMEEVTDDGNADTQNV